MSYPERIHPSIDVGEVFCDMCEENIRTTEERKLFFYWQQKGFVLCVDCLNKLHEDIFGNPFYRPKEIYVKQPIPELLRQQIYARDNFTCQYCGSEKHLSIDHIRPESRGGTMIKENLVTACLKCNSKKNDRTPEEAGMSLINDPRE